MYSKYASNTSPECVTMAQQMSSLNQYDCYAIACNHTNTKSCLDERYVEDCDAFTTMGSRFAAARSGDTTSVARLKTYVSMTKQTLDQYKAMKQSIATILNVSLNDFSVLVFNEFEIVITVWEPHNQYYNDPVSVASLVSTNADFSTAYLKAPSPAVTPAPTPVSKCSNTSLPRANRIEESFFNCVGNLDFNAYTAIDKECKRRVCTCRGGTVQDSGAIDFTCNSDKRDCGTMTCTEVHYTCFMDLYSKYASNTSPECVTMAQQMSSLNQYDCYAIACNHTNTKSCLDERYVEDCDA
eukprot:PhF_6_TR1948/c0_g1_i5/m.3117